AKVEERIEAIEYELAHKMNAMQDVLKLINRFKGLENKMLKMKYVDGITLEEIAENMNYSSSYIYKKHAEIIKRIKFAEELALY
ncbi:ECF-type sigma factor, partial [Bacillus thuringiensis]|uniref:ECF-type sigma factor n=2 Tax=Bacillus TaxID=1386 RepID=UPI00300E58E6